MAQGKASPVPAPEPMFRVSAVLRRYDADVPPTAVGACDGRRLAHLVGKRFVTQMSQLLVQRARRSDE